MSSALEPVLHPPRIITEKEKHLTATITVSAVTAARVRTAFCAAVPRPSLESLMKRSVVVVVALAYLAAVSGITIAAYGEIINRAFQNQLAYTCHDKNVYLSDFVQFYTAGKTSGQDRV